jgi:hypothetical protein
MDSQAKFSKESITGATSILEAKGFHIIIHILI